MRILVVDDDTEVRSAVRMMLERARFKVVEAGTGVEAARALRLHGADLILCDLFMPDKDGLEVICELRRESPSIKVIAMSGGGAKGIIDLLPMALRLGASGILYKPFDQAVAVAAINRFLFPGAKGELPLG